MTPLPEKATEYFMQPPSGVGASGAGPGRGGAAPSSGIRIQSWYKGVVENMMGDICDGIILSF